MKEKALLQYTDIKSILWEYYNKFVEIYKLKKLIEKEMDYE
jgi:hypothetical protein